MARLREEILEEIEYNNRYSLLYSILGALGCFGTIAHGFKVLDSLPEISDYHATSMAVTAAMTAITFSRAGKFNNTSAALEGVLAAHDLAQSAQVPKKQIEV